MQLPEISSVLPVLAWATSEWPMADSMVVARARAFIIILHMLSSPICRARRMVGAFWDARDDAAAGSADVMSQNTAHSSMRYSAGQARIEMPPTCRARLLRRQKAARCPRHPCEGQKGGCVDVYYCPGAGKVKGMGEIALKLLDQLPWISRLPEGPADLLRAGHMHMTGLKQMTKSQNWKPVPAELHSYPCRPEVAVA